MLQLTDCEEAFFQPGRDYIMGKLLSIDFLKSLKNTMLLAMRVNADRIVVVQECDATKDQHCVEV